MRPLVLASASPARVRLLREAGFSPLVVVSGVDEDAVAADVGADDPQELVRQLARAKALAVADRPGVPDGALVLGCDSMLRFGGEVWGKPADEEEAIARWASLSGREGTLLTGHCLVDTRTGGAVDDVASTVVRFGTPTVDEIAAYVASGEPMAVAGGFTLDGRSAPFVDGIDGDFSNVIGLSLPLLRRLLAQVGLGVHDLWT
ncbi:MAG TPA: nucleoside triphosphate pyrophosphatase [Acidimicrobiales bacterium]|nr:nucleoside triphosphate pyrophosphatase [Acidimicrobiales bacterium]